MMSYTQIRDSIVEHVTEVGKQIDGEYHKALTAFLDFVERKDKKLVEAVTLLKANGYIVAAPAAVPAEAVQASTPAATSAPAATDTPAP